MDKAKLESRALGGLNIVGADVVEVAPQYDPTTNTTLLAAQLLFEEFALMATRDLMPERDI